MIYTSVINKLTLLNHSVVIVLNNIECVIQLILVNTVELNLSKFEGISNIFFQ